MRRRRRRGRRVNGDPIVGSELKQLQGVEIPLLRHQSGKLQAARFGISGPIGPILAPLLEPALHRWPTVANYNQLFQLCRTFSRIPNFFSLIFLFFSIRYFLSLVSLEISGFPSLFFWWIPPLKRGIVLYLHSGIFFSSEVEVAYLFLFYLHIFLSIRNSSSFIHNFSLFLARLSISLFFWQISSFFHRKYEIVYFHSNTLFIESSNSLGSFFLVSLSFSRHPTFFFLFLKQIIHFSFFWYIALPSEIRYLLFPFFSSKVQVTFSLFITELNTFYVFFNQTILSHFLLLHLGIQLFSFYQKSRLSSLIQLVSF